MSFFFLALSALFCKDKTLLIVVGFDTEIWDFCRFLKPDLHIVVRVAERACDDASKRILKPSAYRLQIFLVRDQLIYDHYYHMETKP